MGQSAGIVARKVGVSTLTLRRWEENGIIPKAKRQFITGWRVWEDEDVKLIEQVAESRKKYQK